MGEDGEDGEEMRQVDDGLGQRFGSSLATCKRQRVILLFPET